MFNNNNHIQSINTNSNNINDNCDNISVSSFNSFSTNIGINNNMCNNSFQFGNKDLFNIQYVVFN